MILFFRQNVCRKCCNFIYRGPDSGKTLIDSRIIFRKIDEFGGEYMGCKKCKINEAAQIQIGAMDAIEIVDDSEIEDTEGRLSQTFSSIFYH